MRELAEKIVTSEETVDFGPEHAAKKRVINVRKMKFFILRLFYRRIS